MDRKKIPHIRRRLKEIVLVGRNIRRIRIQLGVNLNQLARRADIATSTLHEIETGEIQEPGVYTVIAISRALCVPIWELFREPPEVKRAA